VKFIKFKRLQWAGHILVVRKGNFRIPRRVLDGKFHGRRPMGRPRLRWEDSLLLLNIRGWRDWQGIGISGGELLKRPGPDVGCRPLEKRKQLLLIFMSCFVSLFNKNAI
jgi:hypothetical protein